MSVVKHVWELQDMLINTLSVLLALSRVRNQLVFFINVKHFLEGAFDQIASLTFRNSKN